MRAATFAAAAPLPHTSATTVETRPSACSKTSKKSPPAPKRADCFEATRRCEPSGRSMARPPAMAGSSRVGANEERSGRPMREARLMVYDLSLHEPFQGVGHGFVDSFARNCFHATVRVARPVRLCTTCAARQEFDALPNLLTPLTSRSRSVIGDTEDDL